MALSQFLSTPSARRATTSGGWMLPLYQFLSTPSARRATPFRLPCAMSEAISIHALCEEGDVIAEVGRKFKIISIHALCEEGDDPLVIHRVYLNNFYPRPLRGGRPSAARLVAASASISIHALCEEGDEKSMPNIRKIKNFYPRPLRGGRRGAGFPDNAVVQFLSTPSARRATVGGAGRKPTKDISIHALCEEGDERPTPLSVPVGIFLSTPSARRATEALIHRLLCNAISIHALCEEGDSLQPYTVSPAVAFLSTPSARRATVTKESPLTIQIEFLSTPSARRATLILWKSVDGVTDFYPRPLRGGRLRIHSNQQTLLHFYPRPLRGGRPTWTFIILMSRVISIHALCEEGDC